MQISGGLYQASRLKAELQAARNSGNNKRNVANGGTENIFPAESRWPSRV
jgi:hypothetical protein